MFLSLIIAGYLLPQSFDRTSILIPCKILIGVPFLFSYCSQILWSLISVYRLFLVIGSLRGEIPPCSVRSKLTKAIPVTAFLLSLLIAISASYFSEPFILYRLCLGSCDQFNTDDDSVAVYFSVVPALILYLPAGFSYAIIFLLVQHASNKQKKQKYCASIAKVEDKQTGRFLLAHDPISVLESKIQELYQISHHCQTNSLNPITTPLLSSSTSTITNPQTYQMKSRMSLSLPAKIHLSSRSGSVPAIHWRQTKRKLANRNIISAKLSFLVMVLMLLAGGLLSITYNQVQIFRVRNNLELLMLLIFYIISNKKYDSDL